MVEQWEPCIEQLGTYDPMPNERNEKLVSCNFERIRYWLGEGAAVSHEAKVILGKLIFQEVISSVCLNLYSTVKPFSPPPLIIFVPYYFFHSKIWL